ncbi:MAG TPA: oligosaccharide flippase family protein [Nitrosomonas sp.]|jgi:O-antigen/teichoic acid export membrane protein|nr:oligosaccharide flippase family protein [Nitrosomonas sp.]
MTDAVSLNRSKNYLRQVKSSLIFKGLAVAASIVSMPLMIRYLGNEQYGVWSTLLSIMSWILFFDFGIGCGLRNKVAESMAKSSLSSAASYISIGYTLIGGFSLVLFLLFCFVSFYIPWQFVFNTLSLGDDDLRLVVVVFSVFFFLNFWLGLVNQVLNGLQKTSWVVFGQFLSNFLALVAVYFLVVFAKPSLVYLALCYGSATVLASLALSFYFYNSERVFIPKISLGGDGRKLFKDGFGFFVIQMAVILIFSIDKVLITQFFGPQYVAQYDAVYKLFGLVALLHGLFVAPLWSAYTDAFHNNDFLWIVDAIKKQLLIFLAVMLVSVSLCFIAEPILEIWVGRGVGFSMELVVAMAVFLVVSTWNNIFSYFLNGVGEIKMQVYTAIAGMLINIPLAAVFVYIFGLGMSGVVWATTLSLFIFSVAGPIKVTSILERLKISAYGG